MPVVQMPDGVLVELPDNPTPEQLDSLRKLQQPTVLEEGARVADRAVRGGLASLPGMVGDVMLSSTKNLHQGTDMLPGKPGMLPPQFEVFRLIAEAGKSQPVQQTKFGDVQRNIETVGGALPPKSTPLTEGGKAAANILEPAVATVAGGGVGSFWDKLMVGMAGGAGGEGAARLFGDNMLTRLVGSLLGGGAAGVAVANRPNAENIVRDATKHVTPSDWRRAKVLEATLDENQIPHLKSQLLGPRSTLDDTVAVAGTHPTVRPKLVTKVEGVGDKSRQAYERFASQNLPIDANERAQTLHDVQGAAEAAIQVLKNKANTAYRSKMPPEGGKYTEDYVANIHKQLVTMAKSSKYGETTDAGKAIMRIADDLIEGRETKWIPPEVGKKSVGALIRRYGVQIDNMEQAETFFVRGGLLFRVHEMDGRPMQVKSLRELNGYAPDQLIAVPPILGGEKVKYVTDQHKINNLIKELNLKAAKDDYKGLPIEDVKKMLKDLTPEFEEARAAKTLVSRTEVNPVQRGLAGDLARMGGGMKPDRATAKETALQLVFPQDRLQPQAIMDLSKQIGGDGVGQLLREHLARNMERSAALRGSMGEQVRGPFKFVEAVAGTNAQRQNLEAALKVNAEALGANPQQVRTGFYKLMRAFESTKDLKLPDSIDRAALSQQAGRSVPGILVAPNSRLGRVFWERATAKTYDKIADMVLSKDGLAQLEAIAKSPKPETARQVAISIMASLNAEDEKTD